MFGASACTHPNAPILTHNWHAPIKNHDTIWPAMPSKHGVGFLSYLECRVCVMLSGITASWSIRTLGGRSQVATRKLGHKVRQARKPASLVARQLGHMIEQEAEQQLLNRCPASWKPDSHGKWSQCISYWKTASQEIRKLSCGSRVATHLSDKSAFSTSECQEYQYFLIPNEMTMVHP